MEKVKQILISGNKQNSCNQARRRMFWEYLDMQKYLL